MANFATRAELVRSGVDGDTCTAEGFSLSVTSGTRGAVGYKYVVNRIGATTSATSGGSDTVVLASLPSDTWTALPASTVVPAPLDVTVLSSTGDMLDIPLRRSGTTWQAMSSVTQTNLQFTLWR
jgi:hypothetical protein